MDVALPLKTLGPHWRGHLALMISVIALTYSRQGLPAEQAHNLAGAAMEALASHMGGRHYYLPTGVRLKNALRDAAIYQEFDGTNIDDLASRYRLTNPRVYQIVAEQRELNRLTSKAEGL